MFTKAPMQAKSRGQSLLETALMLPVMLGIALNAVNLGYFFFVTINLTGATRTAAEFSMVGPNSPGTTAYPPACNNTSVCTGAGPNVTDLLYQDLTGAIGKATTQVTVTVCSPALGTSGSGSSSTSKCVACTSSSSSSCSSSAVTPDADPEAPSYLLNRVQVKYQFPPLIPGTVFNLVLLNTAFSSGQYTFFRTIEMRAM